MSGKHLPDFRTCPVPQADMHEIPGLIHDPYAICDTIPFPVFFNKKYYAV